MVRSSHVTTFLGLCSTVRAASLAPRDSNDDTTIRAMTIQGTSVTMVHETILRHPTDSFLSHSVTKTADKTPSVSSTNEETWPKSVREGSSQGTLTSSVDEVSSTTPVTEDPSLTKVPTTSVTTESPTLSVTSEASTALVSNKSFTTSAKNESSTSSFTSESPTSSVNIESSAALVASESLTRSLKSEFPTSSVINESSTTSALNDSSTTSVHGETRTSSVDAGTPVSSVGEKNTPTTTDEFPSATAVDKEATKISPLAPSMTTETPKTSTATATEQASATLTLQITNGTAGDHILPPSQDPWYRAPDNYPYAYRGEALKVRHTPGNLSSLLKNIGQSHQILYKTHDSHMKPAWAVTTVLSPKKHDTLKPAFVTLQVPYHSANVDASPSYLLSTGAASLQWYLLDRMLGLGWHVNLPDYEGPFASFMAPKLMGHAVLGAMRVLHNVCPGLYGVDFHYMRNIAWGYSGGALATAMAYLQMHKYADDMTKKFMHYIMGGMPVDPFNFIEALNGGEEAGVALHAISGMMTEFRHVNGTIQLAAKTRGPFNITVFDRIRTLTPAESKKEFAHQNISDYFVKGLDHVIAELRGDDFIAKQFALTNMPVVKTFGYNKNVFLVYHGLKDELAPIEVIDDMMRKRRDRWCKFGNLVDYYRIHDGNHKDNYDAAVDNVMTWMTTRFKIMHYYAHGRQTHRYSDWDDRHPDHERCAIYNTTLAPDKPWGGNQTFEPDSSKLVDSPRA